MSKTYHATAVREGKWWVITVPDIGATQVRSLYRAPEMAADMVALMLDVAAESVRVEVTPDLGPLGTKATRAKRLLRDLENAQAVAAAASRSTVLELQKAGFTGRDIAAVLEVSPQRVSQLSAAARGPSAADR
ncbi:hypothetical protein [Cellulomonas sp.]|uniref:hypothetical protein n=1 Tax=Cellulomonas sp. TaxID=40001 RepID=UPI003BA92400